MKKKSPAFQFYPNDWLSSPKIMLMTPAEEGAYIRLLSICWMNGGLPDDDDELAKLSRLGDDWLKGGSEKIRKCFTKRRGKLINQRLEKEKKKQRAWTEKSRQGGVQSGKARQQKSLKKKAPSKGGSKMVATKDEPKGNTSSSSSSSSSSSKKKRTNRVFIPPTFEQIKSYIDEKGYNVDPKVFLDFFHPNWIDSKGNKVLNWKQKIITWSSLGNERQTTKTGKRELETAGGGVDRATPRKPFIR